MRTGQTAAGSVTTYWSHAKHYARLHRGRVVSIQVVVKRLLCRGLGVRKTKKRKEDWTPQLNLLTYHRPLSACVQLVYQSLLTVTYFLSQKLVSWRLTSLFSTNMAISETKGQGGELSQPSEGRPADILTSTKAAYLFSSHPKREIDREAHLK